MPFFFTQHCLSYSVDVRESELLALDYEGRVSLVSEAISKWNDVQCAAGPCSARGFLFPAVTCDRVEHNSAQSNANVWVFLDDWYDLDPMALAITTTHINAFSGEVYGSDVTVQSPALVGYDRESLVSILAHEGGHIFGLGHSQNAISMMVEEEGPGLASDPTPDDLKGLCELHPPQAEGSCDPTPQHGFSPLCGGPIENCACSAPGRAQLSHTATTTGLLLLASCALSRRRRSSAKAPLTKPTWAPSRTRTRTRVA